MLDKSIHICHSICQAVEFIHARQDSFGCQRFPLAHRDIKVLDRPNDPGLTLTISVFQYPGFGQRNGCSFG